MAGTQCRIAGGAARAAPARATSAAGTTAAARIRKRFEKPGLGILEVLRISIAAPKAGSRGLVPHEPGEYEIDVAGLLERNPIVVHRDGAYHIHLASLFDSAGKQ